MRTRILTSLFALFLLGVCRSPSAPILHDFSIVGDVTDGNNGKPIAQAQVWLKELGVTQPKAHTYTDVNGRYFMSFQIIYSSSYQLEAFKEGFTGAWGSMHDIESFEDTRKTQTVNFKLYPLNFGSHTESNNN